MTSIGNTTSTTPATPTTPSTDPTSSLIQTAAGSGSQSIGRLATGLDTNAIISALVASERALENPIKNEGTRAQIALQSYALIRSGMSILGTAALALARPSAWNILAASSSADAVASVSAGNGTFSGTFSFTSTHSRPREATWRTPARTSKARSTAASHLAADNN
ncbi:MAG: Flagellar hook-associated protein 2 N-terminus [Actinomycetota bacterium]|nr:Flagellar hook-associated protein 2 N-terminus [Actinomycetota bacterium]